MQSLDHTTIKHTFTTHRVPNGVMAGYIPFNHTPRIGDLIVAEVSSLGRHTSIETPNGTTTNIFPGDLIIGVFGNRYATDQYEGYVPPRPVSECDLLSVGGVCGRVASWHDSMSTPTRLQILGAVCDAEGDPLNQRLFGMPRRISGQSGEVILVVGSSMNSGKTTTVGSLARGLSRAGVRVAAAKVTGTAAGKDGRYFASCGATTVLDFTSAGYPSTYMLELDELMSIYDTLVSHLRAVEPDYILIEIADGIFQRETRMLLEHMPFQLGIDHVFFSAGDSLAAECGVRYLQTRNWPLRAITGVITQSPLAMREAEAVTGMPCCNIPRIVNGDVLELLASPAVLQVGARTTVRQLV